MMGRTSRINNLSAINSYNKQQDIANKETYNITVNLEISVNKKARNAMEAKRLVELEMKEKYPYAKVEIR